MKTLAIVVGILVAGSLVFRAWWWSDTQVAKRMIRGLKKFK